MNATLCWQRGLLALCAIGFIALAFYVFQQSMWSGRAGISHAVTPVSFHDVVTAVVPGWPAAEAGIRAGDTVDLRAASAPDRWRFRNFWPADRPYSYVLVRGETKQRVTFRPRHAGWGLSQWGWFVGALGSLVFAAVIAWLRPWLIEARVLCLYLIVSVLQVCMQPLNWITPWAGVDFTASVLMYVFLASVVLVTYTTLFGRPLSPLRKVFTGLAFLNLAAVALEYLALAVGTWSGRYDLDGGPIGRSPLMNIWGPATCALILLPMALAFAGSRGRERWLFSWTAALPFVVYLETLITSIPAFGSAANAAVYSVCLDIGNTAGFLTPFAIGYALLSRSRFSPITAAAGTMA